MNKGQFVRKLREYADLALRAGKLFRPPVQHVGRLYAAWLVENVPDPKDREEALAAAAGVLNREYLAVTRQPTIEPSAESFLAWIEGE